MNNRTYPNFLIIGAAKAGTTSIYNYLKEHPEIFMTKVKEPCFFSFAEEEVKFLSGKPKFINKFEEYINLFNGAENYKCKGEASTPYLYFYNKTISNLKKFIKEWEKLKIIIKAMLIFPRQIDLV